jgi:hypothetical protein
MSFVGAAMTITAWPGRSRRNFFGTHSSSSTRTGYQVVLGFLERRDCLLSRDAGKVLKEVIERMTRFKVVQQRLDGDPSPHKDGRAAENFGVAVHHSCPAFSYVQPYHQLAEQA